MWRCRTFKCLDFKFDSEESVKNPLFLSIFAYIFIINYVNGFRLAVNYN